MSGETLSNMHEYAEESQNDPGELDPILTLQPEAGVELFLQNVVRGGKAGIPLYARFRDSNNDPIPINSSLTWMARRPGDDTWTVIGNTRDNIQPFVTLDLAGQQNSENAGATSLRLEGPADQSRRVTDVQEFALALESSEQIDWTNSQVYIDEQATATRQV